MQIDIELVGKASRWSYEQPRIRIGRDPSCDLSLPEYSMVSREHLALEVSGAGLSLMDTRSANGTYLNGTRVTAATITSGDTLRLGGEGPELRIYFKEVRPQATVLEGAAAAGFAWRNHVRTQSDGCFGRRSARKCEGVASFIRLRATA